MIRSTSCSRVAPGSSVRASAGLLCGAALQPVAPAENCQESRDHCGSVVPLHSNSSVRLHRHELMGGADGGRWPHEHPVPYTDNAARTVSLNSHVHESVTVCHVFLYLVYSEVHQCTSV